MMFAVHILRNSFLTLVTGAALVACGGSDTPNPPSSSTDASDKYVGTWERCNVFNVVQPGGIGSFTDRLVIAKVSANSYSSTGSRFEYAGTLCAGTGTPVIGEAGTTVFTIVGSKTASGNVVDTLTYPTGPTTTAKDIAYVNLAGPTLQLGSTASGVDADGFPNALNLVRFAKL